MRRVFDSRCTANPRRGSTFVVVLALLALLSIIGLAFVTFTGAEKESAEFFVATSNREVAPQINTDDTLDFGIRQLVLGARRNQYNSALWGGRHSLLAGMFGNNLSPHSGQGIHVGINANTGEYFVDQDFDGQPDPLDQDFDGQPDPQFTSDQRLEINDSPVVQPSPTVRLVRLMPQPDAGYSYPDINNVFLSWRGHTLNSTNNRQAFTVLPSFHRPGLLRNSANSSPTLEQGASIGQPLRNWEVDQRSRAKVLRPHPWHRHVFANGVQSGYSRFVIDKATADALELSGPFPWGTEDVNNNHVLDQGEDTNGNNRLDEEGHFGVWTMTTDQNQPGNSGVRTGQWLRNSNGFYVGGTVNSNGNPIQQTFVPHYAFDADADGDGIREAIWLDLDHPVRVLADGRKVIPLFAFTVLDADGLVNLNTAGNASNRHDPARNPAGRVVGTTPFGGTEDINGNGDLDQGEDTGNPGNQLLDTQLISRSNQGLSPSEVNPQWVLNAHPNFDRPPGQLPAELFRQHVLAFGHSPADRAEAANMEWWFALKGARHPDSTNEYLAGRAGEEQLLSSGGTPGAGISNIDDNHNRGEGQSINTTFGPALMPEALAGFRPFRHPLDFRGSGQSIYFGIDSTDPFHPGDLPSNNPNAAATWKWRPGMAVNTALLPRVRVDRWHQYQGYQASFNNQNHVRWNRYLNGTLTPSPFIDQLLDDEAEMVVDYRFRQPSDAVFAPEENYFLQASDSDAELTAADSRLAALMPYNLRTNRRSESIRHNLTTESWDLKSFRRSPSSRRTWEFPDGQLNTAFALNNKLRPVLYRLLNQSSEVPGSVWPIQVQSLALPSNTGVVNFRTAFFTRRYRLSLNHLLTWNNELANSNELVMRPLTPHPTSLPSSVVPLPAAGQNFPPQNSLQQEAWARYDRQRMARDIYSLLYLFCGGLDNVDPLTVPNNPQGAAPIYTEPRLREMAQFAVNLVDSMDRDNINTLFEYDKNLSDGWSLNDIPYGLQQELPAVRGVVTGVESQELTISEAFTVVTRLVQANGDQVNIPETPDDDRKARAYGWFEIRNSGNEPVDFNRGAWKLQLQVNPGEDTNVNGMIDPGEDTNSDGILTPGFGTTSVIPRGIGLGNQTVLQPGRVLAIGTAADRNHVMIPDPADATAEIPGVARASFLRADTTAGGTAFKHFAPGNSTPTGPYIDLITSNTSQFNLVFERAAGGAPQTITKTPGLADKDDPFYGLLLRGLKQADTSIPPPPANPPQPGQPVGTGLAAALIYQQELLAILKDQPLYILLKRRLHPNRLPPTNAAEEADNPWVTVDRMVIPRESNGPGLGVWKRELALTDQDAGIQNKFNLLRSRERNQPFGRANSDFKFSDGVVATGSFCDPVRALNLYGDSVRRGNTIGNAIYGPNSPIENTTSFRHLVLPQPPQLPQQPFTPQRFSVTQQHLDRDFASPLELLRVPLYGPEESTRLLKDANLKPKDQFLKYNESDLNSPNGPFFPLPQGQRQSNASLPPVTDATVASGRFLSPNHPNTGGMQLQDDPRDNRWHRLLEFVEVATRMERFTSMVNEDSNLNGLLDAGEDLDGDNALDPHLPQNRRHRVPGRINLNTIRNPDVLASLLDEPFAIHRNHNLGGWPSRHLYDRAEPLRDWWRQFTWSRDQIDPLTGFLLPGVPGSRPFRGFGFMADRHNSIEHTLLRSLPMDITSQGNNDRRRLFSLGTEQQWVTNEDNIAGGGNSRFNNTWDVIGGQPEGNLDNRFVLPLDLATRQHINSKIIGNSTVRSHVFHVFLKVEWFEVWQGPLSSNPARLVTRIGARATDVPSRRGFFVIDRSRAIEQAFWNQVLPPPIEDSNLNGQLDNGEDDNEDTNGNGVLDQGEDTNGDGFLNLGNGDGVLTPLPRLYNFADAYQPFDVAPLILYERIIE